MTIDQSKGNTFIMSTLTERYQALCKNLTDTNHNVQLLAVSKGQPISKIRELYALGQRAFGENYLQEAEQKINSCSDLLDIEWHYIGPLQRNKTRHVANLFHWVHSVDRPLLIERLATQREAHLPALNILLQFNVDNEQQKSGAEPSQLNSLIQTISTYNNIRMRGIMGIPQQQSSTGVRDSFNALYRIFQDAQKLISDSDTLSMGMSNDWQLAVQEGATMLRIGTALFGPRNYTKNLE